VRDPYDVLLDDGAVIQHFCNVVCGRPDQLDSALESLMVWLGADKCRQKRMMDVDNLPRIALDELGGKYLHIACQDNQINAFLFQQVTLPPLDFSFIFPGHFHGMKGSAIKIGVAFRVGMIADD
jgi:hypothetical protein